MKENLEKITARDRLDLKTLERGDNGSLRVWRIMKDSKGTLSYSAKVVVCYLDTCLSTPTSCRIWNTQLVLDEW